MAVERASDAWTLVRPTSLVLILSVAAVLASCAGTGTVPDDVQQPTLESDGEGFGGAALAGLCEDADVDIAADEPASPTPEEAVEVFVREHSVLADTTIEGTQILYDGELVGSLNVREAPAGGYYVARAEWCYAD